MHLTEKRLLILLLKEILTTTVGHHLTIMFPEGIAFNIATFLEEDRGEKRNREEYEAFYNTLLTADRKGKRNQFPRYCKNLRYGTFFVYSYSTEVIELNWKRRTAKRLGKWSQTTSRHMNYAMEMLKMCYGFREIK